MPTFVLSWTEYRAAVVEAANPKEAAQRWRNAGEQETNAMSSVTSYENLQIETWHDKRIPVDEDAGVCCPSCGNDVAFVTEFTLSATGETISGVNIPFSNDGFDLTEILGDHDKLDDHSTEDEMAACDACGHCGPMHSFIYNPEEYDQ